MRALYVTPDLSYDYCRRERKKKGEDNKWDGEKTKKKHYPGTRYRSSRATVLLILPVNAAVACLECSDARISHTVLLLHRNGLCDLTGTFQQHEDVLLQLLIE